MLAAALQNKVIACFVVAVLGICLTTMSFAWQILPAMTASTPISKYAKLLRQSPANSEIAVDEPLHGWIDEISFQSGRHATILNNTVDLNRFLQRPVPSLAIVLENKLQLLPADLAAKVKILCKDNAITHSITPGYIIKQRGVLIDPIPVVMISNNYKSQTKQSGAQSVTEGRQ